MVPHGPNILFFATNPDFAYILGDTDLDFGMFLFTFPGSQISRKPAWARFVWARRGPSLGRAIPVSLDFQISNWAGGIVFEFAHSEVQELFSPRTFGILGLIQ